MALLDRLRAAVRRYVQIEVAPRQTSQREVMRQRLALDSRATPINRTPPSPLDGLVPARPLVKAGLDPLDVDRDGTVRRSRWQAQDPQTVLDEIALYNADASGHINNLLRLCLPGNLDVTAYRIVGGRRTDQIDEEATADTKDWALSPDRIGRIYGGGLQSLALVQLRTLITSGALAAEIEPTATLDDIEDVYPVPPGVIDVRVVDGQPYWVYENRKAGTRAQPVALNPNQFIYVPLDPLLSKPHGVSMLLPALETHFMLTEVLRSFVRAAKNQGWARLGVKVLYDVCYDAACQALGMTPEAPEDPEALYTYLGRYLTQIQTEYQKLDADSAWVHWDWAEPDTVGAGHAGESLDPTKAIQAIEQVHITAIKALPTTLGRQWGESLSTTGSIEYKLYVGTAEALRSAIHIWASWVCTQRLRLQGREAYAVVRQEPIRKDELGVEADAFLKRITGYALAEDRGWVDAEYIAQQLFRQAPAGAPRATDTQDRQDLLDRVLSGMLDASPREQDLADQLVEQLTQRRNIPPVPADERRVRMADVEASTDFYAYLRSGRAPKGHRIADGILDAVQEDTKEADNANG